MPPDVREAFERTMRFAADSDRDGVPDVFEGRDGNVTSVTRSRIVVNGREYGSVDEMPPDVRRSFERASGAAGAGHARMPGDPGTGGRSRVRVVTSSTTPTMRGVEGDAVRESKRTMWGLVVAGLLLMIAVLLVIVGLLMSRQ